MRRPTRLLVPLAVALAVALVSSSRSDAGDDWGLAQLAKRPSAWTGHGIGSSVSEKTVIPMPKMPDMPNMPKIPGLKDGKMVTTQKSTLTKITKESYEITVETTSMGRTMKRARDRAARAHRPPEAHRWRPGHGHGRGPDVSLCHQVGGGHVGRVG